MEKVVMNGIILEVEEINQITEESLFSFPLIEQKGNIELRQIDDTTRFFFDKKSKQVVIEMLEYHQEMPLWVEADEFTLQ